MALIHQNLYESEQLSGVNIRTYLEELSNNIIKSQNGAKIKLQLDVSDEVLDLDTAIPVGLMLNELLTNSYKYAFPEDKEGSVTVALSRKEDNSYEMRVSDDGVGIINKNRFKSGKTLGVNLIRGLARQLRGSVEWLERQQGTEVLVRFQAA
jgi:two-component sensor histidine kinase